MPCGRPVAGPRPSGICTPVGDPRDIGSAGGTQGWIPVAFRRPGVAHAALRRCDRDHRDAGTGGGSGPGPTIPRLGEARTGRHGRATASPGGEVRREVSRPPGLGIRGPHRPMSKRLCVKKLCAPSADPVEVIGSDAERPAAAAGRPGNERSGPSARLLPARPAGYPNGTVARLPYRLGGPGCPYRSSRWPQSPRPRRGAARGSARRPAAVAAEAPAAAACTWTANVRQLGSWGLFWYASREVPGAGYLREPAYTRDIRSPVGVGPPIPVIPIRRAAFRRGMPVAARRPGYSRPCGAARYRGGRGPAGPCGPFPPPDRGPDIADTEPPDPAGGRCPGPAPTPTDTRPETFSAPDVLGRR